MPTMQTIGERVRWARGKRGLTLRELEDSADLSVGHAGAIERGVRFAPSGATVAALARVLKVDAAWLMFGGRAPKIAQAK